MNSKLGGYLIGYGIKKKTGEFHKVIFDTPIHNTITKACLNNLLVYNGMNSQNAPAYNNSYGHREWCSLFVKSKNMNGESGRYGVFNYCGLGSGTGTTDVNDTALKNLVGTITDTKKTGSGWCGWSFDNTNAEIKVRVSHTHEISDAFTITEIGWFNREYPSGSFILSSRVQLDHPVTVDSGDTFYSIYEITVSFQDTYSIIDDSWFGKSLLQTNGIFYCSYGNGQLFPFPVIDGNGQGATNNRSGGITGTTAEFPNDGRWAGFDFAWTNNPNKIILFSANYNKLKPFIYNTTLSKSTPNYSYTNKEYITDTFYRDVEFTIAQTSGTFYAINILGTIYRFGSFDNGGTFTPEPITDLPAMKLTIRQSWSTDVLQPSA